MSEADPHPVFELLGEFLRAGDLVGVEIGAARGEDTLRLFSLFGRRLRRLWAFEPDERNYRPFAEDRRLDEFPITFSRNAVGEFSGTTHLHPSSGRPPGHLGPEYEHTYSSSITLPVAHLDVYPWCRFGPPIEVPCISLDQYFKNRQPDRIDFIWCDAQGSERSIIRGGRETLARTKWLFLEHDSQQLYFGAASLPELRAELPGWTLIAGWETEALLRNDNQPLLT